MRVLSGHYFVERMVPYRVHHADSELLLASRGLTILRSDDGGDTFKEIARIPRSFKDRQLGIGRLVARFLRADIHSISPTGDGQLVVFSGRKIFSIGANTGIIESSCAIRGSRPLCVCTTAHEIYYGEYRHNAERSPVHVWASGDGGKTWRAVWQFTDVRHVHGVFEDPTDSSIWITTGDRDQESKIWRTNDNFSSLSAVISKGQQSRAVSLLFSGSAIAFGTDIPDLQNTICLFDRASERQVMCTEVSGPVFFANNAQSHMFFSTAVEPSDINRSKDVVIYASSDWHIWEEAARLKKDWLPPKLFQHGQARFATGPGDGESVWISPIGTTHDQRSFRLTWKD